MHFIFPFAVDKALNYLWAALSSDQLAGQPFCDYVRSLQNDEAFANIRFWTAAQQFLASSLQMDTMTRRKQARALLHIYLLEDSPRKTCLTPEMQTELCEQLPKDSGFVTLNTACWDCAKVSLFDKILFNFNILNFEPDLRLRHYDTLFRVQLVLLYPNRSI